MDDNATNRKILEAQLNNWRMTTTSASSGEEALQKISAQRFDVALLDLQMPGMDGIETTRIIRETFYAKRPFIVALTAEALEGDRERVLSLGFDDYLSKPLQAMALQDTLTSVWTKRQPAELKSLSA